MGTGKEHCLLRQDIYQYNTEQLIWLISVQYGRSAVRLSGWTELCRLADMPDVPVLWEQSHENPRIIPSQHRVDRQQGRGRAVPCSRHCISHCSTGTLHQSNVSIEVCLYLLVCLCLSVCLSLSIHSLLYLSVLPSVCSSGMC